MKNIFDLSGKVAVVTGASSGLGKQFAKTLATAGANVAILARRTEKLAETKQLLEELGSDTLSVKCDITDPDQVAAAVKDGFLFDKRGGACAAAGGGGAFADIVDPDFGRDESGRGETAFRPRQLFRGKSFKRQIVRGAEGQKPALVLLQIEGSDCAERLRNNSRRSAE